MPEQCMESVKSYQQRHQNNVTDIIGVVLVLFIVNFERISIYCSSVSIVDFEQVNVG